MTIVWWEKSVEYAFIATAVNSQNFGWAAPLDGDTESALGDAVSQWDGKLLLIEFKKSIEEINSERAKYFLNEKEESILCINNYDFSSEILPTMEGAKAHALVYGYKTDADKLGLSATLYWEPNNKYDPIEWCQANGVNITIFDEYLTALSGFRFSDSNTGSGSSGSRASVVGIANSGKSFTIELEDYKNLRPKLKLDLKSAQAQVDASTKKKKLS